MTARHILEERGERMRRFATTAPKRRTRKRTLKKTP